MKQILISRKLHETCAAVVVDGELEAIYTSGAENPRLVGNICKGRVKNILPGMRAAFVDIGRDKNAFLQFSAAKKFSVDESVLIQIDKDEIGMKGAHATLNISLAGRFLIFLPTLGYIGVSSKIRGEERNRLHALAKKIRPKDCGLIVRTAAEGCGEEILLDDLAALQKLWAKILERNGKRKAPALLYNANDIIEKIIREEFTEDAQIVVDNLKVQRQLTELVPAEKIIFHEGAAQIFDSCGIAAEIAATRERELPLPNGGRIVFDRTEAMTVVDVNTAKFVGRGDFAETILKTNLEAAELILKQLRLRDLSGIIVADFIDMANDAHKKILMDFLREKARLDRDRTKIIDITPLGLVEITRHS